jgi:uncharacterized repeat protein (TIGR01451 family)
MKSERGRPNTSIALLAVTILCAHLTANATADPNVPCQSGGSGSGPLPLGYKSPFDPCNQDFSVIVYESPNTGTDMNREDKVKEAMQKLGILHYAVRWSAEGHNVTGPDLDANDILIVGWPGNETSGLSSSLLASKIKGRVILTGHDADYHTVNGPVAGEQFLAQAILFVLQARESGTGLIALGDVREENPFPYLPSSWGVIAEEWNGEGVADFTDQGKASGIYDGLTPEGMSGWGTSYHDVFDYWGPDFQPLEYGETQSDTVTIARMGEYGISVTKVDDTAGKPCVSIGERITYTISYSYPPGSGHPTISNVAITDHLPTSVDYYSHTGQNTSYDPCSRTLIWNLVTMSPGSGSVTLTVTYNSSAVPGAYLHNEAVLTGPNIIVRGVEDTRVCCPGGEIIYVRGNATGLNDGSSWANAFTNLRAALDHAATACQKTVWVAQGTYYPSSGQPTPDTGDTFDVPDGVSLHGGFIGTEAPTFDLSIRNLEVTASVLDGTISQQGRNDKVVTMGDGSLLDGFVVTGGGMFGVYGWQADFALQNCQVRNNIDDGVNCGGGTLTVSSCAILDNERNGIYADGLGGYYELVNINNTRVLRNASKASAEASGICVLRSKPTIKNCIISANGPLYAETDGTKYCGIKFDTITEPGNVRNCTIVGNKGFGIYHVNCTNTKVSARNCILWDNNLSVGGDGSQAQTPMDVWYSCVMNGDNANSCIVSDPCFAYTDPNFAAHLLAASLCINAGDPCNSLYYGEKDIDLQDRICDDVRVDIGADEVTCGAISNIYNPLDWDRDGDVDLIQFAVIAAAWKSYSPEQPGVDPNLCAKWNPVANLCNSDYVIDLKDLRVFCNGYPGYSGYPWLACWRAPLPSWPVMEDANQPSETLDPNEPYDPNAPYDPNQLCDPNDPNCPGEYMMGMQGGGMMSLVLAEPQVMLGDAVMSVRAMNQMIDVLSEIVQEQPEAADNINEMLQWIEANAIYLPGTGTFGDYTQ